MKANIYLTNDEGKTPLHLAISRGHWGAVRKITGHRSFRWENVSFQDLVWEALAVKDYKMACKMLELQPDFQFPKTSIPVLIMRCQALSAVIPKYPREHKTRSRKEADLTTLQAFLKCFGSTPRQGIPC